MTKGKPDRVAPALAEQAMRIVINKGGDSHTLYSTYIKWYFNSTRSLSPGCNNCDLLKWYEINMPVELKAITKTRTRKQ